MSDIDVCRDHCSIGHYRTISWDCPFDLQESLFDALGTVLSVNAVNRVTRHTQEKVEQARLAPLSDVRPVVLVDGVWVNVLYAQEETFIRDRAQARRKTWEGVEPVAVPRFFNELELTLNFLNRAFPVPHLIHITNLLERLFEAFRRKER